MSTETPVKRLHPTIRSRLLRGSALVSVAVAMAGAPSVAFGQAVNVSGPALNAINPDGRTATTVTVHGSVTDIKTKTITGGNAYNSFSTFSEASGNTVNLIVPDAAGNLVNIVRSGPVNIQGVLNSYQNGKLGGNIVFADSYGLVVGKSGTINTGGLTVVTPSGATLDQLVDAKGVVNQSLAAQLIAGNVPLSPDGSVVIAGQVNAGHFVKITAQDIRVAGSLEEAKRVAQQRAQFNATVNSQGLNEGGQIVVKNGSIQLVAGNNATIGGKLTANGSATQPGTISVKAQNNVKISQSARLKASANPKAGTAAAPSAAPSISIEAGNTATIAGTLTAEASTSGTAGQISVRGNDISVASTAAFLAEGLGTTDGGHISIKSTHDTTVAAGASFIANALGTGNGGFVELSADNVESIDPAVAINLGSVSGKAGTLLFDPYTLIIGIHTQSGTSSTDDPVIGGAGNTESTSTLTSLHTYGANVELDASGSITVGGTIDTRQYSGVLTGVYANNVLSATSTPSMGNSGSITLKAPTITILSTGALYADVYNTSSTAYTAGTIKLLAASTDNQAIAASSATSSVTIAGTVAGGNITISATSAASTDFDNSIGGMASLPASVDLGILTGLTGGYVGSSASATTTVQSGAKILGSGSVTIASSGSETASDNAISPSPGTAQQLIAAAVVVGKTDASVTTDVQSGARISSGGALTVSAVNSVTLSVGAQVYSSNTAADSAVAYSTGTIRTSALLDHGAIISQAGSLSVVAQNTNSFSTTASAIAAGNANAGVSVAISDINTYATANLAADVGSTAGAGNVTVYSGSDTISNVVQASTTVGSNALTGGILSAVSGADPVLGKIFGPGGFFNSNSGVGQAAVANGTSDTSKGGITLALDLDGQNSSASIAGPTPSAAPTISATGLVAVVSLLTDAGIRTDAASTINSQAIGTPVNPSATTAVSMAVSATQISHNSNAYIGSDAQVSGTGILVDAQTQVPITNSWTDFDSFSSVVSHINGNGGIVNNILTSYANATAESTETGISGAVNYFQVTNNTTAWVASDATLTQTAAVPPAFVIPVPSTLSFSGTDYASFQTININGNIDIEASTQTQSINVGGNFSWLALFGSNSVNNPVIVPGGTSVGGSANVNIFSSSTVAGIGAGASVTAAGSVAVTANTQDLVFGVSPTSGTGSGLGLNGIASVLMIGNNTSATVSDKARIAAPTVSISAEQDLSTFNIAGAVGASASAGVGLAVAIGDIETTTSATIGNNSGALALSGAQSDDANVAPAFTGGYVHSNALSVAALTDGRLMTLSVAAQAATNAFNASLPQPEQKTAPDGASYISQLGYFLFNKASAVLEKLDRAIDSASSATPRSVDGTNSLSGAGSSSVNVTNNATSASVSGATIDALSAGAGGNTVGVQALNNTIITTASGGAALSTGAPGSNYTVAVAGALAVGISSDTTTATISGSGVTATNIGVEALAGGENTAIGLAVALTTGQGQSTAAVSVSGSLLLENNGVNALVDSSTLGGTASSGSGTLAIDADQKTKIGIGAGSLAANMTGGGAGLGVAITYASIGDPTAGDAVSAVLSDSSVANIATLSVLALDQSRIGSGAAVAAGGANTTGFSGAVIVNDIDPTIVAEITSAPASSGTAVVPGGITVSGAVTVSTSGGSNATLDALISSATMAPIGGLASSGNGSGTSQSNFDFSGSAVNPASSTGAAIIAVAGQVAYGKANVGVALVVNQIAQVNEALIEGISVSSTGGTVTVSATNDSEILGVAVGAGVATGSVAGLGSIVYNSIEDGVVAQIGDSGTSFTAVHANGVAVTAEDGSTIRGATGALAANMNSTAVGLAVTVDQISNYVAANVAGGSVTANAASTASADGGSVVISGASDANIMTVAVTAAITAGGVATTPPPGSASAPSPLQAIFASFVPASLSRLQAISSPPPAANPPPQPPSGGSSGAGSLALSTEATSVYAGIGTTGSPSTALSTVEAQNNVVILANNTDAISDYAGSLSLTVGTGSSASASVLINEISGTTDAYVSNGSVSAGAGSTGYTVDNGVVSSSADPSTSVTPASIPSYADGTVVVHGIAVVATSRETTDTVSVVAGGATQGTAIAVNAITNTIHGNTDAYALDSELDGDTAVATTSSNVRIAASSLIFANNLDLGISGSAGSNAGTVALAINLVNGTTSAYSTDTAIGTSSIPAGSVDVLANAWQGTSGEAIGVSASDGIGVAGSALTNVFSATTTAYVKGNFVTAGTLAIKANTVDGYFGVVGNDALGGSAGLGAGVIVAQMENSTSAYLGVLGDGVTVNLNGSSTSGDLDVDATTTTKTESYDLGVSVGGSAGVAAMVTVNLLTNSTFAKIQNASVHISTSSAAAGAVNVVSQENATIDPLTGGIAGGGSLGIGASVNVVILKSSNEALIDEATISTIGALDVSATSDRDINPVTVTGALGGQGALAGTVGVILIGDAASTDQRSVIAASTGSADTATGSGGTVSSALGAGTDGIAATISASTVTAGSVNIAATGDVETLNIVGSLAVGGQGGFGAAVGYTTVDQTITAKATQGTIATSALTISANGGDDGSGNHAARTIAVAGAGGTYVGLGAAVAISNVNNTITSEVNSTVNDGQMTINGATGTIASTSVNVSANDASTSLGDAYGFGLGIAAIGASVATADRTSDVTAEAGATAVITAQTVSVQATESGATYTLGIGGAGGVVGLTGVGATSTDNATVDATVISGATIHATSGLTVSASDTPDAKAFAFGVSAGAAAAGAADADAEATSHVTANVDGGAVLTQTDGLTISATVAVAGTAATSFPATTTVPGATTDFEKGQTTAAAWSIAGSGAVLAAVDSTTAKANSSTTVTADGGDNLRLPSGAISITASNTTNQYAQGDGVTVGGYYAVGAVVLTASASPTTVASLGTGTTSTDPVTTSGVVTTLGTQTVSISATGSDTTNALAVAGSGGLESGDGASATTSDNSSVTTSIGASSNIAAATISISAAHTDTFGEMANSLNAAALGASAAESTHNGTSSVNVTIGNLVALDASAAGLALGCAGNGCTPAIDITASNTFADSASGTQAGAGGGINGAGAVSNVNIDTSGGGTFITIGNGDDFTSGTDPSLAPGSIGIVASSNVRISDQDTLTTGGWIQGAGVNSSINGTVSNAITIGTGVSMGTTGSLDISTYSTGNMSAGGEVTTWGEAAVGSTNAHINVTDNETITVQSSTASPTTLAAFYDVNITAGEDLNHAIQGSMSGTSIAEGYVRGVVAVPLADATTTIASNANVTLGTSSNVFAGENVSIDAYHGTPSVTADGAGHGFELFLIPVTDHNDNTSSPTSSTVSLGGAIVAGEYHALTLTVNADGTVSENAGGAPVSYTYLATNTSSCAGGITASCLFTANEFATLQAHGDISSGNIKAVRLGSLFASGGNVEIMADTLTATGSGTASIAAYGSPSITVNDAQPIALVFIGGAYIPSTPAGLISFTGKINEAAADAAGITHHADGSSAAGLITINLSNTSGDHGEGPPIIVDAPITNLGGEININNSNGSLVYQTIYAYDASGNPILNADGTQKAASIGGSQGNQLVVTVPYGALIVDANTADGSYIAGQSPVTEFDSTATYPGNLNGSDPNGAIMYVASSIYQNHLRSTYGDVSSNSGDNDINSYLYGVALTPTTSAPATHEDVIVLFGACGEGSGGAPCAATGYGVNGYVQPYYTNLSLTYSQSASQESTAGSAASQQIYGNLIDVHAATIDVNGAIYAGPPTTYNVTLGSNIGTIISDLTQYKTAQATGNSSGANSALNALIGIIGNAAYGLTQNASGNSVDLSAYLQFTSNSATNVTASYSFSTGQITLGPIEAHSTGASIILDGAIISSNTYGNIHVNSGFGQVSINNNSGVTLDLGSINTGSVANASAATSTVMIVDRLKDTQGLSAVDTTTYIYNPSTGIKAYTSSNGATPVDGNGNLLAGASVNAALTVNGSVDSYNPVQGAAYQYIQEAQLARQILSNNASGFAGATNWVFTSGSPGNPYYYVSAAGAAAAGNNPATTGISPTAPIGTVIVESASAPAYQETIFGNAVKDTSGVACYQGFNCLVPQKYVEYYPDKAFVRVTSTERADNQIAINFTGNLTGSVNISSNAAIVLTDNIKDPNGATTISTLPTISSASITQTTGMSITGSSISLTAGGAIGTTSAPVVATVTSGLGTTLGSFSANAYGGGVNVQLNSGANGLSVQARAGDVNLSATGNITAVSNNQFASQVYGNNITLSDTNGSIGSGTLLLPIQTNGGVLKVTAFGDIGLEAFYGDLLIKQIASTAGNVWLTVTNGNVYDALSQTSASSLSPDQVTAIATALHLIGTSDANAGAAAITSFQNTVNTNLSTYAAFLANGSVGTGSAVTLDTTTLALYTVFANSAAIQTARANQTGATQFVTPTATQVQATANTLATANGVFTLTLTSANRAGYQAQAAAALGISAANAGSITDTEIQAWANARYQSYASNFSQAYGANWQASVASASSTQATINADLAGYKPLLAAGSVTTSGSVSTFTLNTSALSGYRAAAAISLGISDPSTVTNAQVQTYANSLYQTYATAFAQTYGASWKTTVASATSYAPFSVVAGSALANSLTVSSNWTAQQLVQAIDVSALQPSSTTVGSSAIPDISGHDVTLVTQTGAIGSYNPNGVQISLAQLVNGTLSASDQAALAVATTPGTVSLIGHDAAGNALPAGTGLTGLAAGSTVTGINIAQTAPVFVNASGAFTISSAASVYLQATTGSITLNQLTAHGDVDLKAPGGISVATLSDVPTSSVQITTTGNLDLVASSGSIGSSTTPLTYKIGGALTNASAGGDVYLDIVGGDALIQRDFAGGTASITTAAGYSILSDLIGVNISATNVVLNSGNAIGTSGTPLALLVSGTLSGSSVGLANINAPTVSSQPNALTITSFTAGGNLTLASDGTMTIVTLLHSTGGNVSTTSGALVMDTSSEIVAAGTVFIDTIASATLGDIQSAANPATASGTVTVIAGGSILSNADGLTVVAGTNGTLSLTATAGIGTSTAPLLINAAPLLSASATGTNASIYIEDSHALSASTIGATGAVWLSGPSITVSSITSGGSETLYATGDIDYTTLTSTAGDVSVTSASGGISGTTASADGNLLLAAHGDNLGTTATATTGSAQITSTTGRIGWTTLGAGTTVTATANAGGITFGAVTSGGTQTLNAAGDIGFTTLTSTAGDVSTTSTGGAISGTAVSAEGNVVLAAHGDNLGTTATATTGSAQITSTTGRIGWTTLGAGTTATVTANAGGITFGSVTSGGTQTLNAAADIGFTTLTAISGDVSTTSTGGAISGTTVSAGGNVVLAAHGDNLGTTATATTGSAQITSTTGRIGWTTLGAGTIVTVTANAGGITFGSVTSGGTQTLDAHGALAYTTLRTTGMTGDAGTISLTSDTASITGTGSDTLEANGAFSLTAGTTVSATSLKSDTSSGQVQAGGTISVGATNAATTIGLTSTNGGLTLGSVTSGGTQTLNASGDIGFAALAVTTGNISATSTAGAISGTMITASGTVQLSAASSVTVGTIDPADVSISTPGQITIDSVTASNSVNLAGANIGVNAVTQDAGSTGTFTVNVGGYAGTIGETASLGIGTTNPLLISQLNESSASISTTATQFSIGQGTVTDSLTLLTPTQTLFFSAVSPRPGSGYSVQAFLPQGSFYLQQNGNTTTTNSIVIQYDASAQVREDIGGAIVEGFSLTGYLGQLMGATSGSKGGSDGGSSYPWGQTFDASNPSANTQVSYPDGLDFMPIINLDGFDKKKLKLRLNLTQLDNRPKH